MEGSRSVKIDEIDLKIINHLYHLKKNEQINAYNLADSILKMPKQKKDFIAYRLEKMVGYGLIQVKKNGEVNPTYHYGLLEENVRIRKMKIKELGINSQAIFLNLNGKWCSFLI